MIDCTGLEIAVFFGLYLGLIERLGATGMSVTLRNNGGEMLYRGARIKMDQISVASGRRLISSDSLRYPTGNSANINCDSPFTLIEQSRLLVNDV